MLLILIAKVLVFLFWHKILLYIIQNLFTCQRFEKVKLDLKVLDSEEPLNWFSLFVNYFENSCIFTFIKLKSWCKWFEVSIDCFNFKLERLNRILCYIRTLLNSIVKQFYNFVLSLLHLFFEPSYLTTLVHLSRKQFCEHIATLFYYIWATFQIFALSINLIHSWC